VHVQNDSQSIIIKNEFVEILIIEIFKYRYLDIFNIIMLYKIS